MRRRGGQWPVVGALTLPGEHQHTWHTCRSLRRTVSCAPAGNIRDSVFHWTVYFSSAGEFRFKWQVAKLKCYDEREWIEDFLSQLHILLSLGQCRICRCAYICMLTMVPVVTLKEGRHHKQMSPGLQSLLPTFPTSFGNLRRLGRYKTIFGQYSPSVCMCVHVRVCACVSNDN